MDISYLESLEQKYNFQYPELYKQLCRDGMLDTGEFGSEWFARNYERIKDRPILLVWSTDVELIEESELEEYIKSIKDPDAWSAKPELNLIPFAKCGIGWYCFYYNEQQGDDVPVVIINRYGDTADILAKNLQDFIFRKLILTATIYCMSDDEIKHKEKITYLLRSMFNSHKGYLTDKQAAILEGIYSKEMKECEIDTWGMTTFKKENEVSTWGMITFDEAHNIIKQEIDFPLLDKEFEYYKEEE